MTTLLKSTIPVGIKSMPVRKYIERAWPLLGKKRIESADVKVNGRKTDVVKSGDDLYVYVEGKLNFGLETVYEDDKIIAFIKPEGLPVDADESGIGEDTVYTRLKAKYGEAFLVHRLDTGTGGVMLAAKHAEARDMLENMFREHCFEKTYRADVKGHMPRNEETLNAFIIKDANESLVKVIRNKTANAKDIKTIYQVIDEKNLSGTVVSRLYVNIPTGRTHQIRAHMAFIGHPLLGDDKYGDREINKKLKIKHIRLRCICLEVKPNAILPQYTGMKFLCGEDEKWTC